MRSCSAPSRADVKERCWEGLLDGSPRGPKGSQGTRLRLTKALWRRHQPPPNPSFLPIPPTSSVPPVTRCHLYVREVEPRVYRASSCLYFLPPSPASCPLCWGSERADPALNGSARSRSASPVLKVHNIPPDFAPDLLGFSKVRFFPPTYTPDVVVNVSTLPVSLQAQPCTDAWMVQRYNFLGNVT